MKLQALLFTLIVNLTIAPLPARAVASASKMMVCSEIKKEDFVKQVETQQNKFLKKLELTAEQQEKIKKLRNTHFELIFVQSQKARAAHAEILGAIEKNAPNEVVRERAMNFEKEKQGWMSTRLDLLLAIRDLLTPEQKQKALTAFRDNLHELCN